MQLQTQAASVKLFKKVNRKVQGVPHATVAVNPWHQEEENNTLDSDLVALWTSISFQKI